MGFAMDVLVFLVGFAVGVWLIDIFVVRGLWKLCSAPIFV